MTTRLCFSALIFCLLVSACVPSTIQPQPATPTTEIMPRLDPSPTPAESDLPLNCQITDLPVYIDAAAGYCFAYPQGFTLSEQLSEKPTLRGPALGSPVEPVYATFQVQSAPAQAGQSLDEQADAFLRAFSVVDPATYTRTAVTVDGRPGLLIEPVPVMLSWRIVFVEQDGTLFRLMYWPVDLPEAGADLESLQQVTLNTFSFTQ